MSQALPRPALRLEYDPALPITAHRAGILEALRAHPVIIVCGATGSGKSTQLPKFCLEAGRGRGSGPGLIGHTQPRRIAARALATRLAAELGTTVGGEVGYKVRFNERTGPACRVKLMTDGILLKELESDATLSRYDTLIIDEAHERSLNIDLLLGVIRRLVPRRPDLRVIVTSATIDPGRFSEFFGGAPVVEVSGRSYPVEVRYRPLVAEDEDAADLSLPEGVIEAVRELDRTAGALRGDTLVFLPGEKHIREAAEELRGAKLAGTEVLPLFARLSTREQERIFAGHRGRRVILATNVAETSLTVPGIRHVVDSGLARISRYSVRGKVQRLPIERISRASAEQRKGRCGREAAGICIRLYSEEDFAQREEFTAPEVLRTNLASVILRMAAIGLGEPESFPFIDPPDTRLVNDGVRLLQELKAMDGERRITRLGRDIAALPVDPRLGRMLLAASHQHCLTEMRVITAFLEVQDPRERPPDAQQQAAQKHALFADPRSDFVTVLNLWIQFSARCAELSGGQLRKWCREHFLSFVRMREWQELHGQLSEATHELGFRPNQVTASYGELHQAILTGFLGSIGRLDEQRGYEGPRGTRFVIAPGSPLASRPPRWVVAGSIVETTRVFARMVASVNPAWIEAAGAHLLKRTYSEPQWVRTAGYVAALETVSLYGLTLAAQRKVNYGAIEPREARDIFIREALVNDPRREEPHASGSSEGAPAGTEPDEPGSGRTGHRTRERSGSISPRSGTDAGQREREGAARRERFRFRRGHEPVAVHAAFLTANRRLRAQIEALEAKIRRRDILVDEQAQVGFYAARLPEKVNSVSGFERWWAQAQRADPDRLNMSQSDLMAREAPDAGPGPFPDELRVQANQLPLEYRFEPGEAADGVTVVVPEPLLDTLGAEQLAWMVPGLRLEKITEIFRALPKAQRKLLVPVPEHAKEALRELHAADEPGEALPGFYASLSEWVSRRIGAPVSAAALAALPLPEHLRMNVRVVDAEDRIVAEGRDVAALKRRVFGTGRASDTSPSATLRAPKPAGAKHAGGTPVEGSEAIHRQWDFGDLPESVEVVRNRLRFTLHPAIQDRGTGVAVIELRSVAAANEISRAGIVRLAMLALPQQARWVHKRFADDRELVLMSRSLTRLSPLADAATRRTFAECFVPAAAALPRTAADFGRMLETGRGSLAEAAERLARELTTVLRELRAARAALDSIASRTYSDAVTDINSQLQGLLPEDFIETTPHPWLGHLPRFLKAITRRIGRLGGNLARDAELAGKVKPFAAAHRALAAQAATPAAREHVAQLRWMIEELRVSLFAQDLKTSMKVSEKRLAEQLEMARRATQEL